VTPLELSRDLREGSSEFLNKRRAVALLDYVSMASLGLVSLWQLGITKKIPEPSSRWFDAPKVNGSAEAYSYGGVPDAFLGVVSYGITASLAAAGPQDRWNRPGDRWFAIAMAGKALLDAGQAAKLTYDSWTKYRAFCLWCLIAAGATFATVPLALPEAFAALRNNGR